MTLNSAIENVKEEASSLSKTLRSDIDALNFDLTSLLAIRDKYNAIGLSTLGQNYDRMVSDRSLPPIDPTVLFDQERLGAVGIIATGEVFLPQAASNNLTALQDFYLDFGSNLSAVTAELEANPPREPTDDKFSILSNKYEIRVIARSKANGIAKNRNEIEIEIGTNNFEIFSFSEHPSLLFTIYPVFVGLNKPLAETAKEFDIASDKIAVRTIWYGTLNASTFNLNKMRVKLGLNTRQMRVAAFGDDTAVVSTSYFNDLLDQMDTALNAVDASFNKDKTIRAIQKVKNVAEIMLAQLNFYTTRISDSSVVSNLFEAGVTSAELSYALAHRTDANFNGVNDSANALSSIVFPASSNRSERALLSIALSQSTKSPNFTTPFQNLLVNYRDLLVTSAKHLVTSTSSKLLLLERSNVAASLVSQAFQSVKADVASLREAYQTFLNPPAATPKIAAVPSTESPGNFIFRSTNVIKSLRIQDQISNFPTDTNGNIDSNLTSVLQGLNGITNSLNLFLNVYRTGELRDFLAATVSVSSMSSFLLAGGEPKNSLIVKDRPERINTFRQALQDNIINDPNSAELFNVVSIQIEALWALLVGSEETDPVGKLFDLPISVIDAVTPVIAMSASQQAAFTQLRESFKVLTNIRISVNRDLVTYRANFRSAVADANFMLARLSGSSISELVAELGQI